MLKKLARFKFNAGIYSDCLYYFDVTFKMYCFFRVLRGREKSYVYLLLVVIGVKGDGEKSIQRRATSSENRVQKKNIGRSK